MNSRRTTGTAVLLMVLLMVMSPIAAALDITFDYRFDDSNFFASQNRRDVLQAAGDFWGDRIVDHLTAAISTSPGAESYNADITHPSTGVFGFGAGLENFSVAENEFIIFAGARDLGGSTVGIGGFGGFGNIFGDAAYIANVRTRGQAGVAASPRTDFQRWGGWISFDNRASTDWFFDPNPMSFDGDDFQGAETDFFTFALHEVAHVLGISDSNESWTNNNPFNVAPDGSHLAQGTLGTGGLPGQTESLMVNIVASDGQRKLPTTTDFDALRKVGWEVPEIFLADFNSDGDINGNDLVQWQGDFGLNGSSDSDHDNDSDGQDFLAWQRGVGLGSSHVLISNPVPEPTTVCMLAIGLLMGRSFPRTGRRPFPIILSGKGRSRSLPR